jgi:transcriptional regulator with GAF, ATPase, and Fis domain
MYPVGAEGNEELGFTFKGLVLAATWRDVRDRAIFREDLRARLSDYVLSVPSLTARGADIRQLAEECVAELQAAFRHNRDELLKNTGKMNIDRTRLEKEAEAIASFRLTDDDLETVEQTEWHRRGELRGLVQTIRRAIRSGASLEECLAPEVVEERSTDVALAAFEWLMENEFPEGITLVKAFGGFEGDARRRLAALLKSSPERFAAVARRLQRDPSKLKEDLRELTRG